MAGARPIGLGQRPFDRSRSLMRIIRIAKRVFTVVLSLAGLLWAAPARADADIVLDAEGRTLKAVSHVSRIGTFKIEMPSPADVKMNCGPKPSIFKPGDLELYVQQYGEVQDPDVLAVP